MLPNTSALPSEAAACTAVVEFAGRLETHELVRAYQNADIFVLPSFFEGLPLVVVEALACGCRVVVSDLPGIRPWLEGHVPDAPVVFVRPPRMRTADDPCPEELSLSSVLLALLVKRRIWLHLRAICIRLRGKVLRLVLFLSFTHSVRGDLHDLFRQRRHYTYEAAWGC